MTVISQSSLLFHLRWRICRLNIQQKKYHYKKSQVCSLILQNYKLWNIKVYFRSRADTFFNFLLLHLLFFLHRVRLVERGSPHSLPLMESGKVRGVLRVQLKCWCRWLWFTLVFSLWTDFTGGPNHHRQPRDQGTNGRITSGRGLFLTLKWKNWD